MKRRRAKKAVPKITESYNDPVAPTPEPVATAPVIPAPLTQEDKDRAFALDYLSGRVPDSLGNYFGCANPVSLVGPQEKQSPETTVQPRIRDPYGDRQRARERAQNKGIESGYANDPAAIFRGEK